MEMEKKQQQQNLEAEIKRLKAQQRDLQSKCKEGEKRMQQLTKKNDRLIEKVKKSGVTVCYCKKNPEDLMIKCGEESAESNGCPGNGWFHPVCAGLSDTEVVGIHTWFCQWCKISQGQLSVSSEENLPHFTG